MGERLTPQEKWNQREANRQRKEKRQGGVPGEDTRWEDYTHLPQERHLPGG